MPIFFTFGRNDGDHPFFIRDHAARRSPFGVVPGRRPETVAHESTTTGSGSRTRTVAVFEFVEHDWECSLGTLRGHCFPGSDGPLGCAEQLGDGGAAFGAEHQFHWGETALQFFVDHPME